MTELPPELAPLAHLDEARGEAKLYFTPLLENADALVRVGAWCEVIERDLVEPAQFSRLVSLSATSAAIRSRAFRYFEKQFEHRLAGLVYASASPGADEVETSAMQAELINRADSAEAAASAHY